MDLVNIVKHFNIDGDIANISAFGNGHINSTYKVEIKNGDYDYILQSINTNIFKDVDHLSENILRISEHIKHKLEPVFSEKEILRRSITIVKTNTNELYFTDKEAVVWRMFVFIKDSKTIEILSNTEYAYLAGAGFGDYQWMLSDLPVPKLNEVISDFHNTPLRIENFKKSIAKNSFNRLDEVRKEVDFLLSLAPEMNRIIKYAEDGIIPKRIVHQDTKLSNILFDSMGEFLCVIDLDTTMPGYLCYDFGDAVRGGMNTAAEDEENLENISLNMEFFAAFTKGYAATTNIFISNEEIKTLAFGAKLITFEQSIRFLDDYLNGDKYYHCTKIKHNLIRTRAQIALLKSIIQNFDEMERVVLEGFK